MEIVNDHVTVIGPADPWDSKYDSCIKVLLSGSQSLLDGEKSWQNKMIRALAKLTTTQGKPENWLVINPLMAHQNPDPVIENPEFIQKVQWVLQMEEKAEVVICNFLKSSKNPEAMYTFLRVSSKYPEKVVVRSPIEYSPYSYIKVVCDTQGITLLGNLGTTTDILMAVNNLPGMKKLKDGGLG